MIFNYVFVKKKYLNSCRILKQAKRFAVPATFRKLKYMRKRKWEEINFKEILYFITYMDAFALCKVFASHIRILDFDLLSSSLYHCSICSRGPCWLLYWWAFVAFRPRRCQGFLPSPLMRNDYFRPSQTVQQIRCLDTWDCYVNTWELLAQQSQVLTQRICCHVFEGLYE